MGGGGVAALAIAILLIGGVVVLPIWLRAAGASQRPALGNPPSFGPLAFQPRSTGVGNRVTPADALRGTEASQPDDMVDALIDVRRVERRVNQASIRRMNEIIERHPEAVGQALKRWLNER